MKFCSGHNETINWIWPNYQFGQLHYKDENGYPSGFYMDYLYKTLFFDKIENIKNNCKWIWVDDLGVYVPSNNSYTGALGMIADSKGDTFPRPLDLTLQNGEQFFDFSKTSISVQYFSSQSIERNLPKETKSLASFLLFLVPSLSFALLFLAETVLYFSCLVLFSSGRAAISTRILIDHLNAKGLKMKSLHISFLIFLFLISSMFSSNLNTSNLIVDVSDLLYSKDKILQTDRELCVIDRSGEIDTFSKAPKGSLPYRIYEKANKDELCVLIENNQIGNFMSRDLSKVFYLTHDFIGNFGPKMFQIIKKKDVFMREDPLHESVRSYIIRKKIKKEIKQLLNTCITYHFEFGHLKRLSRDIPIYMPVKMGTKDGEYMIYNSLLDYKNDHTLIEPLSFGRLYVLFKVFFIFQFFVCIAYSIHHLTNNIYLLIKLIKVSFKKLFYQLK